MEEKDPKIRIYLYFGAIIAGIFIILLKNTKNVDRETDFLIGATFVIVGIIGFIYWMIKMIKMRKRKSITIEEEAASSSIPVQSDRQLSTFDKIRKLVTEGSPSAARQSGEAWPLIHFLHKKLEAGNSEEKRDAAHYLCYLPPIGDSDSIEKLTKALLKEDNLDVVKSIIWALRGLEAKEVMPKLREMLTDNRYDAIKEEIEDGIDYLSGN